jgi:hypothetical protein
MSMTAAATAAFAIASETPAWVVLDRLGSSDSNLQREGGSATLCRVAPWSIFGQRFVAVRDGKRIGDVSGREVVAVDCLTGATGVIAAVDFDDAGTPLGMKFKLMLQEVEDTTNFGRISLTAPRDDLAHNLGKLACSCKRPAATVNDVELKETYDRLMKRQMTTKRYRLDYIRVESKERAEALIARYMRAARGCGW